MSDSKKRSSQQDNRRKFIQRVAYTAPTVMTLAAMPSLAQAGSAAPATGGGKEPDPDYERLPGKDPVYERAPEPDQPKPDSKT